MMNMKLLAVVTALTIYHGFSTRKTFWEGKFTSEKNITVCDFSSANMKNCVRCNVSKNREIKGSDKYVTLEISLKFGSMDKIRITSSDPKVNLGRSGKGLITSMGLRAKTGPKKYKKSRYSIVNTSNKYPSNIIEEFERLPYESYEKKRPKHEPTVSYFYLARQLEKCMMIAYDTNLHV